MEPPIKDTPKEDRPPNKGHARSSYSCIEKITSERRQPHKMAGSEGLLYL